MKSSYLLNSVENNNEKRNGEIKKELSDFTDYDTVVILINLEEELTNFKYSKMKNDDEIVN